jgi:hypothetical protein
MAPMTTWASNDDGTVSDQEEAYYRRRAQDVGLVITGCTHVQANGVGFTGEFAAYDDSFIPSLRKLALAAKSGGVPAIRKRLLSAVLTRHQLQFEQAVFLAVRRAGLSACAEQVGRTAFCFFGFLAWGGVALIRT